MITAMRETIPEYNRSIISFNLRSETLPSQVLSDLDVVVKIHLNRKNDDPLYTNTARGIVDDVMYLSSSVNNLVVNSDIYYSQLMGVVPFEGSNRIADHTKGQVVDTYRSLKLNLIDAGLSNILKIQGLEFKGAVVEL